MNLGQTMILRRFFCPGDVPSSLPHCQLAGLIQRQYSSRSNNPYLVLGIPPSSSFRTAQKAFNKLAFQHHPDTGNAGISAAFVRIRQAFERIRAKEFGRKSHRPQHNSGADPSSRSWSETDFLNYFYRQTGVRLASDQRKELVHLYRSRVKGGYYGGHSWELARRLVQEQDAFLWNREGGKEAFQSQPSAKTPNANSLRRRRRR